MAEYKLSYTASEVDERLGKVDNISWNDLKDKPFYATEPVETVIAEGETGNNQFSQISANIQALELGQKYTVVFDGVIYNDLECVDADGLPAVGSLDFSYTDYPFIFGVFEGVGTVGVADNSVTHTIKVVGIYSEVAQLDRKYIAKHLDELTNGIIGKSTTGNTYMVDGYYKTALDGAEIFNDYNNIAAGKYSHAEGHQTTTGGDYAHAEGRGTEARRMSSHAEGDYAIAAGEASHAEGCNTIAFGIYQHAQGKFNAYDVGNTYAHIVGNGTSDSKRSNAHTLDWNGNAWYQGDVYVGGTSKNDSNAKKLATVEYVDSLFDDSIAEIAELVGGV